MGYIDYPNMATYNAIIKTERYLATHNEVLVSLSGGGGIAT